MVWTKEWTEVDGYCTKETIYEKKYFKTGGVARVTMANTNPKGLNFISPKGMAEMCACFREARLDDSIGVVILTGAGDKSFCAGGDL